MNENLFNQMMDEIGDICMAQGDKLEAVPVTFTLVNSKTFTVLYENIENCTGYVRIWDDVNECYKFIPYANILYLEC